QHGSLRGGPDIKFYEQVGRTNFQLVSSHAVARRCELDDVFEGLADRFRDIRLALNQLSDRLLNLDDDARPSISLRTRRSSAKFRNYSSVRTRRSGAIWRISFLIGCVSSN